MKFYIDGVEGIINHLQCLAFRYKNINLFLYFRFNSVITLYVPITVPCLANVIISKLQDAWNSLTIFSQSWEYHIKPVAVQQLLLPLSSLANSPRKLSHYIRPFIQHNSKRNVLVVYLHHGESTALSYPINLK